MGNLGEGKKYTYTQEDQHVDICSLVHQLEDQKVALFPDTISKAQ